MPIARPDQIIITKTPGMIDIPGNTTYLKRLHQAIPDIKLLMVVKNPIDRVISDIIHEFTSGAHKGEPMPPIDDVIMHRAGNISAYRFSGNFDKTITLFNSFFRYIRGCIVHVRLCIAVPDVDVSIPKKEYFCCQWGNDCSKPSG